MRKASKKLIWIGVILFAIYIALGLVNLLDMPHNETLWKFQMASSFIFGFGSVLSIFLGIVARLFSKNIEINENFVEAILPNGDADFRFWRKLNVIGLGILVWTLMFSVMLFDSGPSISAYTVFYLIVFGGLFAIISLLIADKKRNVDINRAIFFLKMPFYYGVIAIITIFLVSFMSGNKL